MSAARERERERESLSRRTREEENKRVGEIIWRKKGGSYIHWRKLRNIASRPKFYANVPISPKGKKSAILYLMG